MSFFPYSPADEGIFLHINTSSATIQLICPFQLNYIPIIKEERDSALLWKIRFSLIPHLFFKTN